MNIRETEEYKSGNFHIVTCPICKHETLDMYWVCEHCGWEYDYTRDENEESFANGMSVKAYREAYLKNPEKWVEAPAESGGKMNIFKYINSKDIKKHLEDIGYSFTSLEAARLIYRCK